MLTGTFLQFCCDRPETDHNTNNCIISLHTGGSNLTKNFDHRLSIYHLNPYYMEKSNSNPMLQACLLDSFNTPV